MYADAVGQASENLMLALILYHLSPMKPKRQPSLDNGCHTKLHLIIRHTKI